MTPKSIGRRRNGKQQACEPCRKSKQSCSHTLPYCDRCVKANKTAECFYHEAPMTKGYDADNPTPLRQSASTLSKRALSLSSGSPTPSSAHRTKSLKESADPPPPPNHGSLFNAPHRWGTSSSNASTSFSAIFRENQDKFGRDIFDIPRGTAASGETSSARHQTKVNKCLTILHALPSEEVSDELLDFKTEQDPLMSMPLLHAAITSLWEVFRLNLQEPRTDKSLQEIAHVLQTNEGIQWTSIGDSSFGEWPNICCGRLLRWEMLGLVFAFFSLAFLNLSVDNPVFQALQETNSSRQVMAWRMKLCADICRDVCEESETSNEMVICLTRQVLTLNLIFWGKENKRVSAGRESLVDAALTFSLNCLPRSLPPSATTEYRRRLFMSIYDVDKTVSWLKGQPPRLLQRDCIMHAPLDLSDEELLGDVIEVGEASSRLDQYGWNVDGKIHEVTAARARFDLSRVKEEIQVVTSCTDRAGKKDGIDELLEKLNSTVARFPSQLHYQDPAPRVDGAPGRAMYTQSILHLEYLLLKYQIERLRIERGRRTSQGLFDTAKEMLETLSHLRTGKAELKGHWFDWLLVVYGYPAAGVLIVTAITSLRFGNLRTPNSSLPPSAPSSQLPPSSQMSNVSTVSQPRNPSQLLAISFSPSEVVQLLNNFLEFLGEYREAGMSPSKTETIMRKLTNLMEQSLSQPNSQGPRSANSSFGGGGPGQLYNNKSANSSFGGFGMGGGGGGGDGGSSQLASFNFNASLTTSGSGTQDNTQLATPIAGGFEATGPPVYLGDGEGRFEEAYFGIRGAIEFVDTHDFTVCAGETDLEVPDAPLYWSHETNGLNSSFGTNDMGNSQ